MVVREVGWWLAWGAVGYNEIWFSRFLSSLIIECSQWFLLDAVADWADELFEPQKARRE